MVDEESSDSGGASPYPALVAKEAAEAAVRVLVTQLAGQQRHLQPSSPASFSAGSAEGGGRGGGGNGEDAGGAGRTRSSRSRTGAVSPPPPPHAAASPQSPPTPMPQQQQQQQVTGPTVRLLLQPSPLVEEDMSTPLGVPSGLGRQQQQQQQQRAEPLPPPPSQPHRPQHQPSAGRVAAFPLPLRAEVSPAQRVYAQQQQQQRQHDGQQAGGGALDSGDSGIWRSPPPPPLQVGPNRHSPSNYARSGSGAALNGVQSTGTQGLRVATGAPAPAPDSVVFPMVARRVRGDSGSDSCSGTSISMTGEECEGYDGWRGVADRPPARTPTSRGSRNTIGGSSSASSNSDNAHSPSSPAYNYRGVNSPSKPGTHLHSTHTEDGMPTSMRLRGVADGLDSPAGHAAPLSLLSESGLQQQRQRAAAHAAASAMGMSGGSPSSSNSRGRESGGGATEATLTPFGSLRPITPSAASAYRAYTPPAAAAAALSFASSTPSTSASSSSSSSSSSSPLSTRPSAAAAAAAVAASYRFSGGIDGTGRVGGGGVGSGDPTSTGTVGSGGGGGGGGGAKQGGSGLQFASSRPPV